MIRRPPRSTRTDTLVPYTTLFRSGRLRMLEHGDAGAALPFQRRLATDMRRLAPVLRALDVEAKAQAVLRLPCDEARSEEHTSELQSLMRISYAVFCLKKKTPLSKTKVHNNSSRQSSTTSTLS